MTAHITATAALSSVGLDADACFDALLAGDSGLHPLRAFDRDRYRVRNSYEIDDRPQGHDRVGRAGEFLRRVVENVLDEAGIDSLAGVPVIVGTGLGELRSAELAYIQGRRLRPDQLDLGGAVRGLRGADDVVTISNACAASLYALGLALDLIRSGRHRRVVVGGVDVLTASMFGLLDRVHADPPDRVRPFDAGRKGVLMGEGAAAVVLSATSPAADRGDGSWTELRSVALGCDAYHVTAPDPTGMERAVREAHRQAGVGPADIDVVYAHGTGTLLNDAAEMQALQRVFDGARPALAAVKGATGHTSGGSGLFSLTMAVRSLERKVVPGVAGLADPIDDAAGFAVSAETQPLARGEFAQVNAFGFGGLNAVAVLERRNSVPIDRTSVASVGGATGGDGRTGAIVGVGAVLPQHGVFAARDIASPVEPAAFDPVAILGTRRLRFKDRATLLATAAVEQALRTAGPSELGEAAQIGVVVASCYGNLDTVCRVAAEIEQGGVQRTSPMELPNASSNIVCSTLAIKYGWKGVNLTITSGADSGAQAIDAAADLLSGGRCRTVVVVAVESANEYESAVREGLPLADGAVCIILTRPGDGDHLRLHRSATAVWAAGDGGPGRSFAGFDLAALGTVLPVAGTAVGVADGSASQSAVPGTPWSVIRC